MSSIKKIDSLTAEQGRQLLASQEEWLAVGRSIDPADRRRTERIIAEMYTAINKSAPYIWWCDGPATGAFVRTILGDNLGANLGANLWANLGANIWANLRDNRGANRGANLEANLGAN